jgi:hypothetical protein
VWPSRQVLYVAGSGLALDPESVAQAKRNDETHTAIAKERMMIPTVRRLPRLAHYAGRIETAGRLAAAPPPLAAFRRDAGNCGRARCEKIAESG